MQIKNLKYSIVLALMALTLSGCRSFEMVMPDGTKVKAFSFANKLSIGEASLSSNGVATLKHYNLDQVTAIQAIAEGVAKGMVEGAKK